MAHFSEEIDEVLQSAVKPRILILGARDLREADSAIQSARLHHAEFVALVQETHASDYLRSTYRQHPLQVETGTWRDLSRLREELGSFDLIYSPSWLDWCDDFQASRWLLEAVGMLKGSGRLIAANSAHCRSEEKLAQLMAEVKASGLRGHAVYRDHSGECIFLEVHSL